MFNTVIEKLVEDGYDVQVEEKEYSSYKKDQQYGYEVTVNGKQCFVTEQDVLNITYGNGNGNEEEDLYNAILERIGLREKKKGDNNLKVILQNFYS